MQYVRNLSREQAIEAFRQSHELWGGKLTIDQRVERQLTRLNNSGADLYVMSGLIDERGALLSSLKRYYFPVTIGANALKAVGLGAIFTHPVHRRKGYAALLTQTVLEECHHECACDVAVLYSDIKPSYYEQFGFQAVGTTSWTVPTDSLPSNNPYEYRDSTPERISELIALREHCTSNTSYRTQRTARSWTLFHEMNGIDRTVILFDDKEVCGFISCSFEDDDGMLWIDEALVLNNDCPRFWSTIRTLAGEYSTVGGWRAPSFAGMSELLGYKEVALSHAQPMIALLDPTLTPLSQDFLSSAYFSPADHF